MATNGVAFLILVRSASQIHSLEAQLLRTTAEARAAQENKDEHALREAALRDNALALAQAQINERDETIVKLQSDLGEAKAVIKELRSTKKALSAAVSTV